MLLCSTRYGLPSELLLSGLSGLTSLAVGAFVGEWMQTLSLVMYSSIFYFLLHALREGNRINI